MVINKRVQLIDKQKIIKLKKALFEIDVSSYVLTYFNGVDFQSFDTIEPKEFGKNFDIEVVHDLKHNIQAYLQLRDDYLK